MIIVCFSNSNSVSVRILQEPNDRFCTQIGKMLHLLLFHVVGYLLLLFDLVKHFLLELWPVPSFLFDIPKAFFFIINYKLIPVWKRMV